MTKRIILALLGILAVFSVSACSGVNTQPDEVALHYSGGSLSSATFKECVESSSRNWDGPGDDHYTYPKGQRTFSFTGREGSEMSPVAVVTNDGQELHVPGFVTFTLNTDCATLQSFHEKVGIKYEAYNNNPGWNEFLNDYVAVPLTASMNKASLASDWRTLYASAEAQAEFERYVKDNLPGEVESALGDDFITINSVSIEKPKPSEGLRQGLAAKEEAKLQNDAQKEKNVIAATKYQSLKDCRESGLTETACITVYLAETGKIPFYPIPQNGSIIVSPR